jgi:tetratricopeptide (TPR) repeat protein
MALPSKKLFLFPALWLVLFGMAIGVLKMDGTTKIPQWAADKRLEAQTDAGIKLLNMLLPPESYYKALLQANASSDAEALPGDLVKYYEQLNRVMPWMAEGYAVLGFCNYRRGQKENAYEQFQKACILDPHFFWACQNSAVMSLEAGRYDAAEQFFSLALNQDPRYTLNVLVSSKVYRDLLTLDPSYNPAAALEERYAQNAKMLYLLNNKIAVRPGDVNLQIKIF